jgi:ribulose-5-phosphate 4-epimerase/fuculose-1-phosphate aldolase
MNKKVYVVESGFETGVGEFIVSEAKKRFDTMDVEAIHCHSGKSLDNVLHNLGKGNQAKVVITVDIDNINLLSLIRKERKDIYAVSFIESCPDVEEAYFSSIDLLKQASVNLVASYCQETSAIDVPWNNIVAVPEESYYSEPYWFDLVRKTLDMAYARSHLSFTRSNVVAGNPVSWSDERVPDSLRKVIDHCVSRGAYKEGPTGATAGHFAVKVDDQTFLTSIRKSNFKDIDKNGLLLVKTDGPDNVTAYGLTEGGKVLKPSVGGQSQRIVFSDHPDLDCIVHFHCPIKKESNVRTVSQWQYECGSHQCGKNTSDGLEEHGNLFAVYLEKHGPNIVFNRSVDPQEVIDFIEANFDLNGKTDGFTYERVD